MKASLICPIYNESSNVEELIKSILSQSKTPDEIIFVDNYSNDGTAEIIRRYSKKNKIIKLIQKKSNIAQARNIAIKNAKNNIIACTDASCKLDKNWFKNIISPFRDKSVDVVSGGYIPISKSFIGKYIAILTVKPMSKWEENNFLPSGRSIAFRKSVWESIGGYPEEIYTGEDTLFDLRAKNKGFKFILAKKAFVYWTPRESISKFLKQFYLYGKGDGQSNNLFYLWKNLIYFVITNILTLALIMGIFFYQYIFWGIFIFALIYFILFGIEEYLLKKDAYCLFIVPILVFIKRVSYFFGVWKGIFIRINGLFKVYFRLT